jgi:hypothetical protein
MAIKGEKNKKLFMAVFKLRVGKVNTRKFFSLLFRSGSINN